MGDMRNDEQRDDKRASTPRSAALLDEQATRGGGREAIANLRAEQRRLEERQDALERALREARARRGAGRKNGNDAGDTSGHDEEEHGARDDHHEHDDDENGRGKGEKDEKDEPEKKKPKLVARVREAAKAHPVRAAAVVLGVAFVVVAGLLYYLHTLRYEGTDDAQIDGDISAVSPRVSGTVTAVYVVDNQVVHAGDPIADLDPRDLDAAVDQARAALAQAEAALAEDRPNVPITTETNQASISTSTEDVVTAAAELATAERDLAQSEAQVAQAEANDRYAQLERQRMGRLASVGAVAATQADQRASAADASSAAVQAAREAALAARKRIDEQKAKLAAARTRLAQTQANAPRELEAREASVAQRRAAIEAARAELEEAELNRGYAHIVAPVDGIVGNKAVAVGDRVQPGQQLAGITQTAQLWVTANFRETQLRKIVPHQHVSVHVDALDLDFQGQVESMPGATGARYSLLPPENATGNYVKVVQRLPVRISLDPGQQGFDRLRPGMSVEPSVTVK